MIRGPVPNLTARPYGLLSVQEVDAPLTERSLTSLLLGREVYRQTEYLALRHGDDVAFVAVRKRAAEPLVLDAVDIARLACEHPARRYQLPCRGSGVQLAMPVEFLDTWPAVRHDWLLIGRERSRQIHRHFFGDEPQWVDICPRRRHDHRDEELSLVKYYLRERGIEDRGKTAVVAWGASLDEIRRALRLLTGVDIPVPVQRA